MPMTPIYVNWTGQSGTVYQYEGYPIGTAMNTVPANYIYAFLSAPGSWTAVYVGECENLQERCGAHEKMPCILRNGGTHIFVRATSAIRQLRLNEETDLRGSLRGVCNDQ